MASSHRFRAAYSSLAAGSVAIQQNRVRNRDNVNPPRKKNNRFRTGNRGGSQGQPATYLLKQPPDEATRYLAKSYFKLIQAIHHKNIMDKAITTQIPPQGMARQVAKLTAFIKPSSPTEEIKAAVAENTKMWMQNNFTLLQDHYLNIILEYNHSPFDETALYIAIGWARKRYGTRLTQFTIEAARSLLECSSDPSHISDSLPPSPVESLQEDPPPGLELGSEEAFPPLPKPQGCLLNSRPVPSTTPGETGPTTGNQRGGEGLMWKLRNSPIQNSQSTPREATPYLESPTGEIEKEHLPPALSPIVQIVKGAGALTPIPPRVPSPSPPSLVNPSLVSPHLRKGKFNESRAQGQQFSSSDEDFRESNRNRKPPAHRRNRSEGQIGLKTYFKQKQIEHSKTFHTADTFLSNVAVMGGSPPIQTLTLDVDNDGCSSLPPGCDAKPGAGLDPRIKRGANSLTNKLVMVDKMMIKRSERHNTADSNNRVTSSDPIKTTFCELNNPTAPGSALAPNITSNDTSRTVLEQRRAETVSRPLYHKARQGRKIQDWNFRGEKPIWFLGDSNLSRLPAYQNQDIQIDSYPGASFYHFQHILDKTPIHSSVKVVVLSVGINNRNQDPHKTSIKQLRTLYRTAESVFPNANIYLPFLNYSPLLPQEQQQNLNTINNFISSRLPFLGPLPGGHFHTTSDNIHWTRETAREMFESWCRELQINLQLLNSPTQG